MPDDVVPGRFSFRRQFPGLRVFEAAAIAVAPASILLAVIASLALGCRAWVVDRVIPLDDPITNTSEFVEIWSQPVPMFPRTTFPAIEACLSPWASVIRPAVLMLGLGPSSSTTRWGHSLIMLLLTLGLWSLVGTILCRRSASRFAGRDESSIRNAIHYGLKRWPASLAAPLIPLFSAALMGLIAAGIGLIGRLPLFGSFWLSIMSPLVAILGFVMAFLLLITAVGWPLMVASVATDDCDSFGGLSRAYSGLTARPWHALGFAAVGLFAGVLMMSFVILLAIFTSYCTVSCVGLGSGVDRATESLSKNMTSLAQVISAGVGISYFWSLATVVSLLLRQEVDGVPLDRLALDDDERPVPDPFPVVGIPATDARDIPNQGA